MRLAGAVPLALPDWRQTTLIVSAIIIATLHVGIALMTWEARDMAAYTGAADRLLAGEPLYPPMPPDAPDVYRYAPWFAIAWIPLTLLPEPLVLIAWTGTLALATGLVVRPLLSAGPIGWWLAAYLGGLLLMTAAWGNVQPLIILALLYALPGRWGPIAVGVTASLKVVPILYAAVWAWQGEWRKVAISVGVAAILWAPALLFDLSAYPTGGGEAIITGPLWLHAVAALGLVALVGAVEPKYRVAVASLAAMAALPRFHTYDATFLMVSQVPSSVTDPNDA